LLAAFRGARKQTNPLNLSTLTENSKQFARVPSAATAPEDGVCVASVQHAVSQQMNCNRWCMPVCCPLHSKNQQKTIKDNFEKFKHIPFQIMF
jgi:hypothetical protein